MSQFTRFSLIAVTATIAVATMCQPSRAELSKISCGAPIESTFISDDTPFHTSSKSFVRINNAVFTTQVPDGETRCIKVRFTGGAICRGNSNPPTCFIRALIQGAVAHPFAGPNQGFGSAITNATGLGYQWAGRIGPGNHTIQIQLRTNNVPGNMTVGVDDWAMDVEVLEDTTTTSTP
jgi:hypothetical protein